MFGVYTEDGTPVAFPVVAARDVIDAGGSVSLFGIEVLADAGGVRAVDGSGDAAG